MAAEKQPIAGTASLEHVVEDDTGSMSNVFLGRSKFGGIDIGAHQLLRR